MSWFFKNNINEDPNGKPVWQDVTFSEETFSYLLSIGLVIVFTILLFIVPSYIFFSFISICFVLYIISSYKGNLNGKYVYIYNIFFDILNFYKVTIVSIFSFFVITSAFVNLGRYQGFTALLILAMFIKYTTYIDTTNPEYLSTLVSDDQAGKFFTCSIPNIKKSNSWWSWLNPLNLFHKNQNGGNIAKKLKNLSYK